MRLTLCLALLLATSATAFAQALREIPDSEAFPVGVMASLTASLTADEVPDGIRRWEGNLVGDATPDYLVEAVIPFPGGNSFYVRHWIFIGSPDGFTAFFPIEIAGTITTAVIAGNALVVTVPRLRPGEARCCPTGSEVIRLPLN